MGEVSVLLNFLYFKHFKYSHHEYKVFPRVFLFYYSQRPRYVSPCPGSYIMPISMAVRWVSQEAQKPQSAAVLLSKTAAINADKTKNLYHRGLPTTG